MDRLSAVSNPNRTSVAALLLGALVVTSGLQLMRVLFVEMAVYLTQVQAISSIAVGAMGLAVFLCGFLEPVVRRVLGARNALPVVAGSLALVRVAEQVVSSLPVDLGLSIAGTVLFLWSLPLMFRSVRAGGLPGGPAHAAIAFLLGISLDTALKGVFGTIDLSWAPGVAAHGVVLGLAAAQGLLLWRLRSVRSEEEEQGVPASVLPYLAFGPALALELLLFQNIAQQTALIGWPQPAVYTSVLGANLAGVTVTVELARSDRPLPWPVLALLGGLLVSTVWGEHTGVVAAIVVLVGHVVIAALLASVVKGALKSPARPATDSASVWISVGMTLMLLLFFIYYASYDTDVLAPKEAVRPLAALVVGLAALWASGARRSGGVSATSIARIASVPALLLLLLPLLQLAAWKDVTPTAGAGFPVRVMTYNLHQGFDVNGRHGLEEMAKVIEAEDPDIVALQEVSRGWVVNGSVDMLTWLSQRLQMDYVWGPAADSAWGNALLSRFPIAGHGNYAMPNNDALRFDRAFLVVEVDLGGGEVVDVVATHFHSGEDDSALRVPQSLAVLQAIDAARNVVLLADLNALPGDPEMRLLADAGLNDTFVASGATGDGFTSPSDAPRQRIDYVWASPDLKARDFSVPRSPASDHLAAAVTLYR